MKLQNKKNTGNNTKEFLISKGPKQNYIPWQGTNIARPRKPLNNCKSSMLSIRCDFILQVLQVLYSNPSVLVHGRWHLPQLKFKSIMKDESEYLYLSKIDNYNDIPSITTGSLDHLRCNNIHHIDLGFGLVKMQE